MGRYAQAQRRGGSPPVPPPPPTGLNFVAAIDLGGGHLLIGFDGPATLIPANLPEALSLTTFGSPLSVISGVQVAPTGFNLLTALDPLAFQLLGWAQQPPWVLEPVNLASTIAVS